MTESETADGSASFEDDSVDRSDNRGSSRRLVFGVVLAGGTMILTLALLEVAVRVMNPPIQVGPAIVTFSDVLGFENKRNLLCTRRSAEYDTTIQTNSMGMRGAEIPVTKRDGVTRILCVGDSYTFGRGVENEETYVRQLEIGLNDAYETGSFEVLNGGVVGWGTGNELLYLRERGMTLRPDIVLLQIYTNDFADNMRSTLFSLDDSGHLHRGRAYAGLKTITGLFNSIPGKSLLENAYLFNYARTFLNISVRPGGKDESEMSIDELNREKERSGKLTAKLLEAFVTFTHSRHVALVVVTVDLSPEQASVVVPILDKANVPTLHLDSMRSDHPEMYFRYDMHWNRDGHRAVANRLRDLVTEVMAGGQAE
jgi:lysophospholipase L1-like esterase